MAKKSVQAILKEHGIRPKRRFGQNFLTPTPTIEKIVNSLDPKQSDKLIEIGPGLGLMTSIAASKVGHVFAVDMDADILEIAQTEFGEIDNIDWIEGDILAKSIKDIVGEADQAGPFKILGNLPYNISSPILFWMLDHRPAITRAVVMLQKEVAVRIVAKPGGKDFGILSVFMQAFADCKKLFDISGKSFIPPPNVTSSVISIDFSTEESGIEDEDWFRLVVKAAFGKRRKTIRNSLIGAQTIDLSAQTIDLALDECQIDPKRRAETISVSEFIDLANKLPANG
jgi:16S rRNA (adenine1518-N6/adenine1519-N6)-dimethyltransferase